MGDLIKKLRDHGEGDVSYSYHRSREMSREAAYEIVRLRDALEIERCISAARIAELESDLDAAEEYICELKIDQWGE